MGRGREGEKGISLRVKLGSKRSKRDVPFIHFMTDILLEVTTNLTQEGKVEDKGDDETGKGEEEDEDGKDHEVEGEGERGGGILKGDHVEEFLLIDHDKVEVVGVDGLPWTLGEEDTLPIFKGEEDEEGDGVGGLFGLFNTTEEAVMSVGGDTIGTVGHDIGEGVGNITGANNTPGLSGLVEEEKEGDGDTGDEDITGGADGDLGLDGGKGCTDTDEGDGSV